MSNAIEWISGRIWYWISWTKTAVGIETEWHHIKD